MDRRPPPEATFTCFINARQRSPLQCRVSQSFGQAHTLASPDFLSSPPPAASRRPSGLKAVPLDPRRVEGKEPHHFVGTAAKSRRFSAILIWRITELLFGVPRRRRRNRPIRQRHRRGKAGALRAYSSGPCHADSPRPLRPPPTAVQLLSASRRVRFKF